MCALLILLDLMGQIADYADLDNVAEYNSCKNNGRGMITGVESPCKPFL
jgi:hypothetical protein